MEKDKSFLGTQPVGKLLFKLSLPTVIAQIVNMLYNIVDRIYIGHMPGDGSLADNHDNLGVRRVRQRGRRAQGVDIHG